MSESYQSPALGATVAEVPKLETTRPKRILLVEGDGFTRLVLLLRLRLAGFGVDFTSNGILGLGKLRTCHPDVLLVELKLCGLYGLELIKAARAEPTFGNRPIFVYTQANQMSRTTRKEVGMLATKLFDKSSVTREELVQTFARMFLDSESQGKQAAVSAVAKLPPEALSKVVLPRAIEEIIAGVRDQSNLLAKCKDAVARTATGSELLSRVCSLTSCAEVAGLPNLARQARALESFLDQLCRHRDGYTQTALSTMTRAVEVMGRMSFEATGKSLTRFTVAIVDESPSSNKAISEGLFHAGFEPVSFEDPAYAREYLARHGTELIITNLSLPEAHGLALGDIRQLALHAKTPVIFGPEPTAIVPLGEEVPTSALRLDTEPLLLTELVVRALNEVQRTKARAPGRPVSASPAPASARQPSASPGTGASPMFDDVFELFARSPQQGQVPPLQSSPRSAAVAAEALNPPLVWTAESLPEENPIQDISVQPLATGTNGHQSTKPLFPSAAISGGPVLRAEPGTNGAEYEAELLAQLPAASIDGSQVDERPIEGLPPSALQPATEPPQPDPTIADQTAAAECLASAAGENGETPPPTSTEFTLEPYEAPAILEPTTAIQANGEFVKDQLEPAQTEYAQQGESAQQQCTAMNDHNHQRGDLAARICAAEMELHGAQVQIERRDQAIEALLRQLAEAKAGQPHAGHELAAETPAPDIAAGSQAQARCVQLEQELAALRQAFEGLNGNFAQDQQAAAEADRRVTELMQRLSQSEAELEKQRKEQERKESDSRRQFEETNAASQQSEAARQQAEARCTQLEQELAELRQMREQLAVKPAPEQQPGVDSRGGLKQSEDKLPAGGAEAAGSATELEQQVRQGVADLARATADLAKERGVRQRTEQRAAELNARLQALHEDFSRTLQAQRENLVRISALEEQQRQADEALARRTADVEQQKAERRLAEEQLRKAKEVNAQVRKDLSFSEKANQRFEEARQELQSRLEASLNVARENESRLQRESVERQQLAESLAGVQHELANQARRREALELELQTARDALQEHEAKWQKEAAERQRLKEALDGAQRELRARSGQGDLEFSKLQSALELEQVERNRQETKLARLRHTALDAAHAARALRTSLRRQIREPADNLVHSARRLLELEMGEEQTKVAEAVLQDVLLLQTRLREPELAQGDSAEADPPQNVTPA